MGLTRQLGERITSLRFEDIPPAAVDTVKRGMIDTVGVLFAGREQAVVQIILRNLPKGDEAGLLFTDRKAGSGDAALVNATAGHALDYDDTGIDGHPSVVLAPVVLAEGERLGARGKALIAAYVAGYETWAELASRDADKHHGKGWHPTAVFGTIGAAAAACKLSNLNPEQTVHALAIAASMSAGLVANFGTMGKPFQVGRAAQNGIQAARLAAAGMSAAPDTLEHPGGLLAAFSPHGRVRLDGALGEWHILRHGLNFKRYPVCYAIHRCIDAVLEGDFPSEELLSVEVRIGKLQAAMLRHSSPQSALDAKFSAQFAMAAALLSRRVGLAELTDAYVQREDVQALMRKVRVTSTDETDAETPLFAPSDQVFLELRNGETVATRAVRYPKGHARNPLSLEELRAKFDDCTAGTQQTLFQRIIGLEDFNGEKSGTDHVYP
jgi:2-methylcitrate dehydratase PrpD